MHILAVNTLGETLDVPDAKQAIPHPHLLGDALTRIGFNYDTPVFIAERLAREADIQMRHSASDLAADPIAQNIKALHDVAVAGAKHGAHEIRLTSRGSK